MPFSLKTAAILVGLYFTALLFSFISEVSYKKRAIADVRQNWKSIVTRTSIIFAVFIISSIIWSLYGHQNK